MTQLSKHFKRGEFNCKCGCGFNTVDAELLEALEGVRQYFNKPVSIKSGCRCKAHNETVGGSKKSKHMLGIAADISVSGVSPQSVYNYLIACYPDKYGIAHAKSFCHIDVRAEKARWVY